MRPWSPPNRTAVVREAVAKRVGLDDPGSILVLSSSFRPHGYGEVFSAIVTLPDGRQLTVEGHDYWATGDSFPVADSIEEVAAALAS